ncbi:ankyrin repeat domain-containing protein, partial [Rhodococcus erythropolis]
MTGALAGCSSSDTAVTSTIAASATTAAAVSITGVKPPSTPESERALFDAVDRNDPAAITAALASGANIEARGEGERTPLVEATKNDAVAAASTLILAGADVNAKDSMQDSAFLYSGAEGLNEILALTLAHGADVDSVNR